MPAIMTPNHAPLARRVASYSRAGLHSLVLLAALCSGLWTGQGQSLTLLEDTFSDGQRDNQNLPASAAWYLLNDNTVLPTATVTAEGDLWWADKAGTYAGLIAHFTAVDQVRSLGIGDSLKLEFRCALETLSNAGRVMRIGLMNSGGKRVTADALNSGTTGLSVGTTFNEWRGYALLTSAADGPVANGLYVVERSGVNTALWSSGAFSQIGAGVDTPVFIAFEYIAVELLITRRAADVELSGRIGDAVVGPVTDAAGLVTSFDTVALFVQPQIAALRLDDARVTFIPNPAAADDPNAVVLTETVFGRLPLDASAPLGQVRIRNGGTQQSLVVQANSSLTGPDASLFRIQTPLPLTIAPGQTGVVEVLLEPRGRYGDLAATLELRSNDPSEPVLPVALEARYFRSGDELASNAGFEADPPLSGWATAGNPQIVEGLGAGSTNAVLLVETAAVGQTDLIVPSDFHLDFRFAVLDSFELILKSFPSFDRGNAMFDLRYQFGQFNVYSNGVWSEDLGLGQLEPSMDNNFDNDLMDAEDTRNVYRMRLMARGWGTANPSYDLALSGPNSDHLTNVITGLNAFGGGGGGGAAPPTVLLFSSAAYPSFYVDEVHLRAGQPRGPSFRITGIRRESANAQIILTWESESGASYRIESSSALGGSWTALATGLTGQAGQTSYTDSQTAPSTRYYRVVRQ